MTSEKKDAAVDGSKKHQLEWMIEEINEFYEAVSTCDRVEILDEAIGLIRTTQQFASSKRVMAKWSTVSRDVCTVLSFDKRVFYAAFKKWKEKKSKKGQAKGVTAQHLIDFAKLKF